jgi:hypothetical protein
MHLRTTIALAITLLISNANQTRAAIIYSTSGSTYSQNFDSLPNTPENSSLGTTANGIGWTDDNASPPSGQFSIVGWYLFHPISQAEGGANGNQRMRIGAGTVNTGAFMSFGASGSTERALGAVNSNTLAAAGTGSAYYGARLTNNTGQTLTEFTLSYNGEQWRDGGNSPAVAQSLTFGYMVGAANIQDPGFITGETALNFNSPVFTNTGSGAAVNGNVAGRVAIGPKAVGVNWAPGTDLWIRWADLNDTGNDHGLGIDDLNFSADVPEPSSLMLLAAAVVGLALAKRQ